MRKVSIILVVIAAICTFFIKFETTSNRKADLEEKGIVDLIQIKMIENEYDGISWALSNMQDQYHTNNDLSFFDGVKNGILAPASYAKDVIVGTICDYLSGFKDKGFVGKIGWAIFGLIFEFFKNALFSIFGSIIFIFKLLFQKGSLFYYVGYIISTLISLSFIAQAIGVEEETVKIEY